MERKIAHFDDRPKGLCKIALNLIRFMHYSEQ